MPSDEPVYTPEYQAAIAKLLRGLGDAAYGSISWIPGAQHGIAGARSLLRGTPYADEKAALDAYEQEQRLAEAPSEVDDPSFMPGKVKPANREQMMAQVQEALNTAATIGSTALSRRLREGTLSLSSLKKLPQHDISSGVFEKIPQYTGRPFPQTPTWPRDAQADVLEWLHRELLLPKELPLHVRTRRGEINRGLVEQAAKRDPSMEFTDSIRQAGLTRWPFMSPKENVPHIMLQRDPREYYNLMRGTYPKVPAGDVMLPEVATTRRAVMEHELGERALMRGEAEAVPFSSHLGPEANIRELAILGSQDPRLAVSRLHWKHDSPAFAKFYKQAGGTPSSPILPGTRRAKTLTRLLRDRARLPESPFESHLSDWMSMKLRAPVKRPAPTQFELRFKPKKGE